MLFLSFSVASVMGQNTNSTITSNEELRHSYEFPVILTNSTDFLKKLTDLLNLMNQSQNQLLSNGTSQVVNNPADAKRLNDDLNTLLNSGQISSNDYTVLQSILSNNTNLAQLLQALSKDNLNDIVSMLQALQNVKDPNQAKQMYQNILSIINDRYKSGNMSLADYIAALKALQLIGSSKNLDIIDLNNELKIAESEYLKSMISLLNSVNNLKTPIGESQLNFNKSSIIPSSNLISQPLSNINALPSGLTLPSGMQISDTLIILAISIVVMLILLWKWNAIFSSVMRMIEHNKTVSVSTDLEKYGESVKLYWSAVNILSKRIPINSYDTHREYASKVLQGLPSVGGDFNKIAMTYELERFGGVKSNELIDDAKRAFKNILTMELK
ncbi:MAG: DUF4129 domain-containing protein [Thermoprotei archaeon]|jgi:hypothetical protein